MAERENFPEIRKKFEKLTNNEKKGDNVGEEVQEKSVTTTTKSIQESDNQDNTIVQLTKDKEQVQKNKIDHNCSETSALSRPKLKNKPLPPVPAFLPPKIRLTTSLTHKLSSQHIDTKSGLILEFIYISIFNFLIFFILDHPS